MSSSVQKGKPALPKKEKHSLLLVDDEPDILFSLKGLLRQEFELYTANSAKEAMQVLAEHPIQIVMTDQRMPEMTGVELLGKVRTEFPEAVRIVFTGYADIKAVVDAINTGGLFRYITKPWDPDELIEVLHEAGARYDELVERQQLLADLRSYVSRTREVISTVKSDTTLQLQDQATHLLERLEHSRHPAP